MLPMIILALAVIGLIVLVYFVFDLLGLWPGLASIWRLAVQRTKEESGVLKSIRNESDRAPDRVEPASSPAPPTGSTGRVPGAHASSAPTAGSPSFTLRGQIAELEEANRSVGRRNRYLFATFLMGILLVVLVFWVVYRNEVLSYAVVDSLSILRDPVNEGRFRISFEVTSPGKVLYRRTSGSIETEVVDVFRVPGVYFRSWGWVYEPGKDTEVGLRYRKGLWRADRSEVFPTSDSADIVILMDTTGSMSRSIAQLKEKCVFFSEQLKKQNLKHRFALIGFGDRGEGSWLDKHAFTDDVKKFRRDVETIKRFDGGDFPESALDALEEALALPFNEGAIRRFYLVTDAEFHEPTSSGLRASDVGARLESERILLSVFSSPEYQAQYTKLLGTSGKFQELSSFGEVLAQGRVLED
jgi:hypothetical protein